MPRRSTSRRKASAKRCLASLYGFPPNPTALVRHAQPRAGLQNRSSARRATEFGDHDGSRRQHGIRTPKTSYSSTVSNSDCTTGTPPRRCNTSTRRLLGSLRQSSASQWALKSQSSGGRSITSPAAARLFAAISTSASATTRSTSWLGSRPAGYPERIATAQREGTPSAFSADAERQQGGTKKRLIGCGRQQR